MPLSPDELGLGIMETFTRQLPEGAYFLCDESRDGRKHLFRLVTGDKGIRYVAYIVKVQNPNDLGRSLIFYQAIAVKLYDMASIDVVYSKVRDAIKEFSEKLATGRARTIEDGGKLEFDEPIAEPAEADPERHD
jgi:hypothetical protein